MPQPKDMPPIAALARERIVGAKAPALHVDWCGGEPMLNVEFIEACSTALQRLCTELRARYSASVISNGTRWPADVEAFIGRHQIRQVQVSFDGRGAALSVRPAGG